MDVLPTPAPNPLKRAADSPVKAVKKMKLDGKRVVSVFYLRCSNGVQQNEKMCDIELDAGDTPKVGEVNF
jgi:hypothetical protein